MISRGNVKQLFSFEEPIYVPVVYIFAMKHLNALLSTLRVIIEFKELDTRLTRSSPISVRIFHVKWSQN